MIYIGVDPGKDGAMAIIGRSPSGIEIYPFTSIDEMKEKLNYHLPWFATIEMVHAMNESVAKTTFEFGKNLGEWIGLFTGLGIPYQLVPPATWQKVMMPGKPSRQPLPHKREKLPNGKYKKLPEEQKKANDRVSAANRKAIKEHACQVARGLWPNADFKRTDKCKGPHSGMVDAALIAEYGRRMKQ